MDSTSECRLEVVHYFREPSQYTVLIIISNDVSKVVTKVGINIYEGEIPLFPLSIIMSFI
jgi:hypothetical protein